MFVCPTCGFSNHEGALFCEACGTYFHTGGVLATQQLENAPASKPAPSGFPQPKPTLEVTDQWLVLTREADQRRFTIASTQPTTLVGRSDRKARVFVDVDLSAEDEQTFGISRRHARIHFLDGHFLLEDLESLNGTSLNGRQLRPYLPEVLHDGDEVKLGSLVLKAALQAKPAEP